MAATQHHAQLVERTDQEHARSMSLVQIRVAAPHPEIKQSDRELKRSAGEDAQRADKIEEREREFRVLNGEVAHGMGVSASQIRLSRPKPVAFRVTASQNMPLRSGEELAQDGLEERMKERMGMLHAAVVQLERKAVELGFVTMSLFAPPSRQTPT